MEMNTSPIVGLFDRKVCLSHHIHTLFSLDDSGEWAVVRIFL